MFGRRQQADLLQKQGQIPSKHNILWFCPPPSHQIALNLWGEPLKRNMRLWYNRKNGRNGTARETEGCAMRLTTLCYIERDGQYVMLHRIKKDGDENAGKWIGIGGHVEENESPRECVLREIREETGLAVTELKLRGVITFILPDWGNELTFLYTARTDDSALPECAEGVLQWVPIRQITCLPLWEGDKVFLPLLQQDLPYFSLKLIYAPGGELTGYELDT